MSIGFARERTQLQHRRDAALRVLIAEDETLIRMDLRALLERHGFAVCGEARDGLEAVALARELQPDACVVDVRMPNLDGIEASRRIYAERPLPIVLVTAFSERRLVERAIDAGVFAYLVKPFREVDVVPAMHSAVARHAELLAARRVVGSSAESIEVALRSPAGHVWPLRVHRLADGTVRVSVAAEGGEVV